METKFQLAQFAAILLSTLLATAARAEAPPTAHKDAKVCRGHAVRAFDIHEVPFTTLPFKTLHAPAAKACPRSGMAEQPFRQCWIGDFTDLEGEPDTPVFAQHDSARVPAKYFQFIREETR